MSDELKPRNRTEQYYEYMATGENAAELTPRSRQEQWFEKIAEGRISDYAELENIPIQPASESEVDGNYYYSEGSITRRIDGEDYELATLKDVDDAVTSVYKYKGSVATYSDLPSEDLTIGDVYNVISDGNNYAWDGSDWDQLGGFKTNYPFNPNWHTSLTTNDFCADVDADGEAIEGMTYLGDVYFSDLPFNGNGDLVVEVIQGTGTSGKVIHLILTSGNVAPYRWEYTYWNNGSSTSGWLSWQTPIDSIHQLSAEYIATDSNHLFVTDSEKSTWNGKQDLIDSTHKLAPEYINTDSTARFVTDSEKSTWSGKQDVIDSSHKLAPEYINTDSTARFISDSELNAKQDVIDSTHQLNAEYINTDSSHLFVTDSEKSTWNSKQNAITDGSATIATIDSSNIITIKTGIAQSSGAVANDSGSDIILAKVAKTGAYENLSDKPTLYMHIIRIYSTAFEDDDYDVVFQVLLNTQAAINTTAKLFNMFNDLYASTGPVHFPCSGAFHHLIGGGDPDPPIYNSSPVIAISYNGSTCSMSFLQTTTTAGQYTGKTLTKSFTAASPGQHGVSDCVYPIPITNATPYNTPLT